MNKIGLKRVNVGDGVVDLGNQSGAVTNGAVIDAQRPLDRVKHVLNGPINGIVGGTEDEAVAGGVNNCCNLQIVV